MASTPTPDGGDPPDGDAPDGARPHAGDAPRVLVVMLGDGVLAVRAEQAGAVVRPGPVTPVGGTPAWVLGVAAVRGRVMAVGDARRLAGVPAAIEAATDDASDAWWLIVDDGRRAAALAGLRVRSVVPAEIGDAGHGGGEVAPPIPGLPARGVARLTGDGPRGAEALPPAAALLDVGALLDVLYDPTPDGD